jgi:aspartyl-tRNA(Asn)/glutamyl-tRNA(Gln) amidotransferase subunit B
MTTSEHPLSRLDDVLERWEPVIGIEVHCQLKTASKMFCGCSTAYDGAPPNSHCCPVCLGLPGALPVINRHAVELVLATGAALGASTPDATRWDRKNYFYPDLPKGYQISQYDLPLASNGRLDVETSSGTVTVGITRAHLEEDTAKLLHAPGPDGRPLSLVDFNRSGAPLMEIVTDPDVRSAEAARAYAEELQLLLRTVGASDADMERGQMRVEANVSIRPRGTEPFGTRIEVKNMNSFRSVERAVAHEIERQAAILESGGSLSLETRGWSDDRGATYRMRGKETSEDYRYFPEPDLPPLRISRAWLAEVRASMPELPAARRARFESALGLSPYDARVLVADREAAVLFEATLAAAADAGADGQTATDGQAGAATAVPALAPKTVANWITGEVLRLRNAGSVAHPTSPSELVALIRLVDAGTISRANAKSVLEEHVASGAPVAAIVERSGLRQISDSGALATVADEVIAANPAAVADVRAGKDQAIRFLVGQVMKATRGQANATAAEAALRDRLGSTG